MDNFLRVTAHGCALFIETLDSCELNCSALFNQHIIGWISKVLSLFPRILKLMLRSPIIKCPDELDRFRSFWPQRFYFTFISELMGLLNSIAEKTLPTKLTL